MNKPSLSLQPDFRDDLQRWQQLISPTWLANLIKGRTVVAAPTAHWCLFEVDFGAPCLFLESHIPGAGYLDTNRLEQQPLWNKVADQALLQLLLTLGVRHDTTVILYGRHTPAAARAAQLMLYAGVTDVRMLDGGLPAWVRAGLPLGTGAPCCPLPVRDFGAPFPGCPHYMIDTDQVKALLRQQDGALVSVRTWNEFIGKTSGYCYIVARGDIAGARWGQAGDDGDVNSMSAFHRPDGTMKPASDICAFWRAAGIHPHQQTAFFCGTGWRASLAFYYAWLMDWQHISVYDGGWFEWSSNPDNPVTSHSSIARRP